MYPVYSIYAKFQRIAQLYFNDDDRHLSRMQGEILCLFTSKQLVMHDTIHLTDVTFLIPVRIDTIERMENLVAVTNYLLHHFDTNIIVLEAAGFNNGFLKKCLSEKVQWHFVEDERMIFHRTYYLNQLTAMASTPYVAVWDADVLVKEHQLTEAVNKLRRGETDFIFPYDGMFLDTGMANRMDFMQFGDLGRFDKELPKMSVPYGYTACGGGFLAATEIYRSMGMENENFFGWGPEDGERVKRWGILNARYTRIKGPLFHFTHPRGVNSGFRTDDDKKAGLREYLRICRMSKEELQQEVLSWLNATAC